MLKPMCAVAVNASECLSVQVQSSLQYPSGPAFQRYVALLRQEAIVSPEAAGFSVI